LTTDHTPRSTLDALRSTPTALLTGCSTNIGRATAQLLARRGWRVFASARRPESVADLASDAIVPIQLDVTNEASRCQAKAQYGTPLKALKDVPDPRKARGQCYVCSQMGFPSAETYQPTAWIVILLASAQLGRERL